MEASALQAPAGFARSRTSLGAPLLRLRSDEQLVALFRAGHDEAFRVIHDRYRQRLFAYARQMLRGSRQDAEDALQDVFVRAYAGLRANDSTLALRAWLYRVAHNRCVDELRRPAPPAPEVIELVRSPSHDPIAQAEQRESLRRLIEDVRRLPEQQRSALLMRELSGMTYTELADTLGVSVPAIKSLLVRARVSLAQSMEARDTACSEIREELSLAHDRGVRPNGMARRHLRDCAACRDFRGGVRGTSRQLAALVPALGPVGLLANLLGWGGGTSGGAAAGGGVAGGGVAATGAAGGGGVAVAGGLLASSAGHVATMLAAAAVAAGGAIEFQHTMSTPPTRHHPHHSMTAARTGRSGVLAGGARSVSGPAPVNSGTSRPAPASPAAEPVRTSRAATDHAHSGSPAVPVAPSAGTRSSGTGPNPYGGSTFDAQTGVGPADVPGSATTPSGSVPSASGGTGTGDSTSSNGSSPSSSTGGTSGSTTSYSPAGQTTTRMGSGPSAAPAETSGPASAGSASAGSGTAATGGTAGTAHSATVPHQSSTTSRN